jgi:hypothetical protein
VPKKKPVSKKHSPEFEAAVEGEKTDGIKRVTLAEQGPRLPIGSDIGVGLSNVIETRRWNMKVERSLGERRKVMDGGGDNMARYVSAVLTAMCPKLGAYESDETDVISNEIKVGQMWLPDVLYAYLWVRLQALGPDLPLKIKSPYTQEEFSWTGDLNTVTVKVPENLESAFWDYELKEPFEIRGNIVTSLRMGPQVWNIVEQLNPGTATDAIAKSAAIRGSIHEIPEIQKGPIAIIDAEIDEMGKKDIEQISHLIDVNGVGPIMVLEIEDPTVVVQPGHPPKKFLNQIDWRYDNFFVTSSR